MWQVCTRYYWGFCFNTETKSINCLSVCTTVWSRFSFNTKLLLFLRLKYLHTCCYCHSLVCLSFTRFFSMQILYSYILCKIVQYLYIVLNHIILFHSYLKRNYNENCVALASAVWDVCFCFCFCSSPSDTRAVRAIYQLN